IPRAAGAARRGAGLGLRARRAAPSSVAARARPPARGRAGQRRRPAAGRGRTRARARRRSHPAAQPDPPAYAAPGPLCLPQLRLPGAAVLLAVPRLQRLGDLRATPSGRTRMKSYPAEAIARSRVLVVGDIMLDRYWFGEVDRISPEAPVPVVRVARREDRLGGAANVARNVAALGGQATLLGIVGADEAGEGIGRLAGQAGVQADLVADADHPTTLKMRVLGRQQQLLRVDFEQHPAPATLDGLDARYARHLAQHDVVVLSDYAKGALDRVQDLIAQARAAGV